MFKRGTIDFILLKKIIHICWNLTVIFLNFVFQFDYTSQPWGEDSSPLVDTLQSMVCTMKLKTEMTGPTAGAFKSLSLDDRLSKLTRPLDDRTK